MCIHPIIEHRMKEEKYIQSLFDQARHEEPKLSFEEVAHDLDVAINPSKVAVLKDWFFNHIYLITFIAIITIFILTGFMFVNSQTNATTIIASTLPIDSPKLPAENISNPTNTKKDQKQIEIQKEEFPQKNIVKKKESKIIIRNKQPIKLLTSSPKTTLPVSLTNKKTRIAKEVNAKEIDNQKPLNPSTQIAKKSQEKEINLTRKIASKHDNQSELEIVLETALNTDKLKEDLFIKNRTGDFQQLIIKTNNKFSNLINVNFAGKKAIVLKSGYDGSFNIVNDDFVDIQSLKIEKEKATLEFIYNSEFIQVELEKIDGEWLHKYTGKSYAQEDHFVRQELLQMLVDHEKMVKLLEKNKKGNTKPFKLLSNGLLSDHHQVSFAGTDLEIVSYPNSLRESYVKITKFQVRKKKAVVEFIYQGKTNMVNFRNKGDEWVIRSFKVNMK